MSDRRFADRSPQEKREAFNAMGREIEEKLLGENELFALFVVSNDANGSTIQYVSSTVRADMVEAIFRWVLIQKQITQN